ncbi:hypothetical protein CY0110_18977 [Crocosphaera chwakensis CCY0110]|uniref:Uncharacterized protein n=1 Tax=Crocosphaera chwakensis CCY0110 TaxID=391612 RepID=A3IJC7_9CHRO|nr:hypothetical protein CY0110_18977 [Crocosphaera chwakensis CCY0110]
MRHQVAIPLLDCEERPYYGGQPLPHYPLRKSQHRLG